MLPLTDRASHAIFGLSILMPLALYKLPEFTQ